MEIFIKEVIKMGFFKHAEVPNFQWAMGMLLKGHKVRNSEWSEDIYWVIEDGELVEYEDGKPSTNVIDVYFIAGDTWELYEEALN